MSETTKTTETIASDALAKLAATKGENVHIVWEKKLSPSPLPLHEPNVINLSGTIDAPYEFITKRKDEHNPMGVTITYNLELGKIKLVADERDHFKTTVEGELKKNPKMEAFGINVDKKYQLTDLKKLIRYNKIIFKNESEWKDLMDGLNKFQANVAQELKKEDDGKGNVDERFLQSVSSNLKTTFVAKMEIFKGHGAREFQVEIMLESRSRVIDFWFESPEAVEVVDVEREGLVMAQIDKLSELYVCIQQ